MLNKYGPTPNHFPCVWSFLKKTLLTKLVGRFEWNVSLMWCKEKNKSFCFMQVFKVFRLVAKSYKIFAEDV